jgi:translation factor GUF1, mitochondrial
LIIGLVTGDKIASCHSGKKYDVTEVGIMHPEETSTGRLLAGQVGYIACNMKESSEGMSLRPMNLSADAKRYAALIGDTFYRVGAKVDPMPGFKPSKAMVRQFMKLYCWFLPSHPDRYVGICRSFPC